MATALSRMSFEECLRNAEKAQRRLARAMRKESAEPAPRGRSYHGVYSGARQSRLEYDWITSCQAADEEVKRDAYKLRSRARDLAKNNPLAKQYLRLVVLNVVGANGPKHDGQIRDNNGSLSSKLNKRVEAAFSEWSEGPVSLDGRFNFAALQRQAVRAARGDGEILLRMWRGPGIPNDFGLALEPIDPDQLDHLLNVDRGENRVEIRMGIEVDLHGRPVAYHVWDRPFSFAAQRERVRIPAEEILHVYDPDRVNQSRGVTDFHPVTLALHFCGEYSEAELIAARVGASQVVIWKRMKDGLIAGSGDPNDPNQPAREPISELEPGMFGFAPEGYEPANVDIAHPSDAFGAFLRDQKQEIASGLGISYAALTSDLSQTSFSSARTGTLLERDTWRGMQAWWLSSFVQPVYRSWLRESLLIGGETGGKKGLVLDMRDPRRLVAAKWTPRGWDWVDPLKDANAAIALVGNGLNSRSRIAAARGDDLEDIFDELQAEQDMARERGITISDAGSAVKLQDAQTEADAVDAEDAADAEDATTPGREHRNGHAGRFAHLLTGGGK